MAANSPNEASLQPAPSTPVPAGGGGILTPLTPIAPACPPPPPIVSHLDLIVANLSDGACSSPSSLPPSNANAAPSIGTPNKTGPSPPSAGRKRSRSDVNNGVSSKISSEADGTPPAPSTPPPGLESQYNELDRLLTRGLIGTEEDRKRNVSALLMGPRGCGKSLVVERVLSDLRIRGVKHSSSASDTSSEDEQDDNDEDDDDCNNHHSSEGRFFRIVRLNGLLLRGDDVGAAVREMVRQLSDVAAAEARYRQRQRQRRKRTETGMARAARGAGGEASSAAPTDSHANDNDNDDYAGSIASDLLRIRRQGFNSNLALLDETLRAARVDSMPILVVLDELDAFLPTGGAGPAVGLPGGSSSSGAGGSGRVGTRGPQGETSGGGSGPASSDRQLLLYHLLDRVADHRTLLSLVGMTSQLSTVGTFEKRVRSRAEGTSKIIYIGRPATYENLVKALSSKFDVVSPSSSYDSGNNDEEDNALDAKKSCRRLGDQLVNILLPSRGRRIDLDVENDDAKVRAVFRRNYQLGKDVRWFCRVLTVALSLLAEDCTGTVMLDTSSSSSDSTSKLTGLTSRYIMEALMTMGGMIRTEEDSGTTITMSSSGGIGNTLTSSQGMSRTSLSSSSITPYGPFDKNGRPTSQPGWDDPRIQELLDLPESQLAVLLSARRILCRDAAEDSSMPKPLTFGRIKREFETFYRGNVGSGLSPNLYEGNLLHFAFLHLMETGLICPAVDHTGGGPLQYYMHHTRTHAAMEPMALAKMPLHVLVDINSELGLLLKDKMLDCSTALREWGLRIN